MDGWEVSRDLIEKGEELGSGSFGVCHRGVYKHQDKVIVDPLESVLAEFIYTKTR